MNSPDTTEADREGQSVSHPGRHIITFLVVTAFLNTMGSGVLSPVLPFLVRQYISNESILAVVVGWLVAIYALCQFIAAPGLGLLSDRFGRRPLLLMCLLGSAIGYALFGLGGALWVLFLGRIIDGLTGGNVSILFAYIGDISTPQERAKYFGLFGAAAGFGFIVGPVLGGFASQLSYAAPVSIAAAIFVATVVWGSFNVPESLSQEHRTYWPDGAQSVQTTAQGVRHTAAALAAAGHVFLRLPLCHVRVHDRGAAQRQPGMESHEHRPGVFRGRCRGYRDAGNPDRALLAGLR